MIEKRDGKMARKANGSNVTCGDITFRDDLRFRGFKEVIKTRQIKLMRIVMGGIVVFSLVAWMFLPYDRNHLLQLEGGSLRTTYNIWTGVLNKVWDHRGRAVAENSGGIGIGKQGSFIRGRRVAFEMISNRVPGVHIFVTEDGELFVDRGSGPQPLELHSR